MTTRGLGLTVFDNALHVLWQICAIVGLVTIPWVPASIDALRPLFAPLLAGLAFGLLTMPAVLRRIRPGMARRFPWAFGD